MNSNDPFENMTDAPAFQVIEAKREAIPSLTALWGFSDSGKTFSALRYARGLVGPKGKIVLIDTENKRAKFYAGKFGGFGHIDLQPPFTPQRYTAAIEAAVKSGADAVIIDSATHVWQGEGGVLEQAEARKPGIGKWAVKIPYTRMVNRMLRSPVHMIFCLRAKEHYVQKGHGASATIEHLGQVPIFGAGFIYEMTVAIRMESGTRQPLTVKAPDPIANIIKPGEFISEEHGQKIAAWLADGDAVNHEVETLKTTARHEAAGGTKALRKWWGENVTKDQRKALEGIIPELANLAAEADKAEAENAPATVGPEADPLADAFTPEKQAA